MSTLEQLRVERDYLLNLLKDLKKQAEPGTTSESPATNLYKEYEAELIRVKRDIAHRECHQAGEQIAPHQPEIETVQPLQNPHIIKIETTHTYIRNPVIPRTKPIRVIQSQKNNDS
jgi:hypothetical protein